VTPADLSRLESLAREATPGPWENCGHERGGCGCGAVWSIPADSPVATVTLGEWGDEWPVIDKDADGNPIAIMRKSSYGEVPPALGKANAAYIAAANPAAVLALIERVTAQDELLAQCKATLEALHPSTDLPDSDVARLYNAMMEKLT